MRAFLKRLITPEPAPLDADESQLALAALLVRLARADAAYDMVEAAAITRILIERFGLDHGAAEDLRAEAEAVEAEAPDTVRFTRAIKAAVEYDDRIGIVEAMWAVVLADGHRDADEDGQMRLMVNLLGVNDRDSALARQRMAARPV